MDNNEQEIIEEGVNIDGDINVSGFEDLTRIDEQILDNTQLLNGILKQLKEINKTLKKIYQ